MPASQQFLAAFDPVTRMVRFILAFAAPQGEEAGFDAPALLDFGDNDSSDLGILCAPDASTWRHEREKLVATHTYAGGGPFSARLQWGEKTLTAHVDTTPGATANAVAPANPVLSLLEVKRTVGDIYSATLSVRVTDLSADQHVRVDAGPGQVFWLDSAGHVAEGTLALAYSKSGTYTVAADLLDSQGFWLADLGETPLTIEEAPIVAVEAPVPEAAGVEFTATLDISMEEVAPSSTTSTPWLPFRYARPSWAWARTYRTPGGAVSRSLAPGTYVAIRQEAAVNGQLWYQTGAYDWIAANTVNVLQPSELRGVELTASPPPPPPPPDPGNVRYGVVTAQVLNVRGQPGVRADNPVIGSLTYNTSVTIYEESTYAGAKWYRIGEGRWVYGAYVRVLPAATGIQPVAVPVTAALQPALPIGWVVSTSLNVRSQPGTSGTIVGEIVHSQAVNVLETRTVDGQPWYRIGSGQWVLGTWVGVARAKPRPASIGSKERWVGVSLKEQTVIAYEGDKPVYAALAATGLPGTPTVQGVYRTWWRVPSRRMAGGSGAGYYYLEEVTWTCYFYGGYALHTAYWHDAFGRPRSHGCVNLSPYDAWWLFQWSAPGGANSPAVYVYWA